jgi:ribosome-binding factor A
MTRRLERINALLRNEISAVLASELTDPRLVSMVSVTEVDCGRDLSHAKVFVSILGAQHQKKSTLAALQSAAGFVHRTLRSRVDLRAVPTLDFRLDESIELGMDLLEKIRDNAPLPGTQHQE